MYWCVDFWCEYGVSCEWGLWRESPIDCALLKVGNCFKTLKEAEENKYHIYKELTGKEWGE